jgi:hypothetical protein
MQLLKIETTTHGCVGMVHKNESISEPRMKHIGEEPNDPYGDEVTKASY